MRDLLRDSHDYACDGEANPGPSERERRPHVRGKSDFVPCPSKSDGVFVEEGARGAIFARGPRRNPVIMLPSRLEPKSAWH
jgi:hypothetical protein